MAVFWIEHPVKVTVPATADLGFAVQVSRPAGLPPVRVSVTEAVLVVTVVFAALRITTVTEPIDAFARALEG